MAPNAVAISELAGEGHWFDGIMDDDVMQSFYQQALAQPTLPPLPRRFQSVSYNPASSSGRGGVRIEQLRTPYRLARASVDRGADDPAAAGPWVISTENVRRLSFYALADRPLPSGGVVVDGTPFLGALPPHAPAHLCALGHERPPAWRLCEGEEASAWLATERSAANYGPLRQVFHTAQLFLVYGTQAPSQAYNALLQSRARFVANAAYYQVGHTHTRNNLKPPTTVNHTAGLNSAYYYCNS